MMNIMDELYSLSTGYDFHFIVVGVGGTGAEFVPKLCKQLSFKRNPDGTTIHDVTLIDGDKVEEKNLLRQNFFYHDLGKNKADVMGLKCSTAFNMSVRTIPEYIEDKETLHSVVSMLPHQVPFLVSCVDTNAARKMFHTYFMEYSSSSRPLFYLDSGNTEFAGQVVLGVAGKKGKAVTQSGGVQIGTGEDKLYKKLYRYNLPPVAYHYPDILESEDKFASQISCAEAAMADPQAADTNVEAGNILYQFVSNCLRGHLDYHHVTFNVLKGNRRTIPNTSTILKGWNLKFPKEELEKAISERENLPKEILLVSSSPAERVEELNRSVREILEAPFAPLIPLENRRIYTSEPSLDEVLAVGSSVQDSPPIPSFAEALDMYASQSAGHSNITVTPLGDEVEVAAGQTTHVEFSAVF